MRSGLPKAQKGGSPDLEPQPRKIKACSVFGAFSETDSCYGRSIKTLDQTFLLIDSPPNLAPRAGSPERAHRRKALVTQGAAPAIPCFEGSRKGSSPKGIGDRAAKYSVRIWPRPSRKGSSPKGIGDCLHFSVLIRVSESRKGSSPKGIGDSGFCAILPSLKSWVPKGLIAERHW